jgi:hypothetical protein
MGEHSSLQKIVIILSGATLVLLVGVGYMVWLLTAKQNESSQTHNNSSSQKNSELVRAQYKTLLEKTKEDRQKLSSFVVVGDAGTAQLLEKIETLGTTHGLVISQGVSLEKVSSSTRALVVTIETKGAFQKVIALLASLEALPHELVFRNVALRRTSEIVKTGADWSLNVAFTIKSFQL